MTPCCIWWLTILIYLLIAILIFFLLNREYYDLYCDGYGSNHCGYGKGRPYVDGRVFDSDDIDTILDKIVISSKYEYRTITWRLNLIISLVLSFIIVCITGYLCNGILFISITLIIYVGLIILAEIRKKYITYFATSQMIESVEILKSKILVT